jgi:hypothetical protein
MVTRRPAEFAQTSASGNDFACTRLLDQLGLQESILIIGKNGLYATGEYLGLYYNHDWLYVIGVEIASCLLAEIGFENKRKLTALGPTPTRSGLSLGPGDETLEKKLSGLGTKIERIKETGWDDVFTKNIPILPRQLLDLLRLLVLFRHNK